jgi:tetratricopeptide (TPR) repeat protein
MTQTIDSPPKGSLQTLRSALELAERQAARLDGTNIETFLVGLDRIEQMFVEFAPEKSAVRSEDGRWQGLLNRVVAHPELVVNAAGRAGGLTKLRAKHAPAVGHWWRLDADIARRRAQTFKRTGLIAGAIVVLAIAIFISNNYFAASNSAVGSLADTSAAIEPLLAKQKWPEALALVQKARQALPKDPELLVWAAVLAEQSGDSAQANASLTQAQQNFTGPIAAFWTLVGNRRLQVGNWDGAEEAAKQALTSAPQDAQITFLLGNVAQARGDSLQANAFFSKTIALAGDANPSLAALVRVRMGYETQKVAPMPAPVPDQPITQTLTPKAP